MVLRRFLQKDLFWAASKQELESNLSLREFCHTHKKDIMVLSRRNDVGSNEFILPFSFVFFPVNNTTMLQQHTNTP